VPELSPASAKIHRRAHTHNHHLVRFPVGSHKVSYAKFLRVLGSIIVPRVTTANTMGTMGPCARSQLAKHRLLLEPLRPPRQSRFAACRTVG
jgi:hypothetical protein